MIYILDRSEKIIGLLHNNTDRGNPNIYFDDLHTEDLTTGAETFSFCSFCDRKMSSALTVGNYVAFKKNNSYRLMQIIETEEDKEDILVKNVYCETVGLELLNSIYDGNIMENVDIERFLDTVLQDTYWQVGYVDSNLTNNLALEIEPKEVYSLIQEHISSFGAEIQFRVEIKNNRVVGRYIDAFAKRGNNNGRRLEIHRDIRKIVRRIDLSNYATKLIGVGKDNLSFKDITVNGIDKPLGQNFIVDEDAYERLNYKGNHITRKFEFDTTDAKELLRQTKKALEEMSKPQVTYEIDTNLMDLDNVEIGDTIIVSDMSFEPQLTISTRVGILETSKSDKSKNKAVLTNFKEIKSGISRFPIGGNDILDGAITGDKIDSEYTEGIISNSVNASTIKAELIVTENLKATNAEIENLKATNAEIENLLAGNITADNITAGAITADKIQAGAITADKIVSGTITADKIQAGAITAGSGIIANGAIGSAQISSVDAGKINTGTLETSRVTIQGADGHLRIKGNRLQVFNGIGTQAKERVSVGDVNGDGTVYGLRVRGADGETVLLDENGITKEGITNGSINNDKISDDANIDGGKININSVIDRINEDGTGTIHGTKIDIDGESVTSKVFQIELNQNEHLEIIEQQQSEINQNKANINLKVSNQKYTEDMSSMTSRLEKTESDINILNDSISLTVKKSELENEINDVVKDSLDGVVEDMKDYTNSSIREYSSSIDVEFDNITSRVEVAEKTVNSVNQKYTEIKQTVDSIDITGKVSFSDLSTSGKTTINGANITTGYISGDRIKGGIISATDEINFVGGARMFGTAGSFGAGLKTSAQEYNFKDGDAYFESNLYAQKGFSVDGTSTFKGAVTCNSNFTSSGTVKGSTLNGSTLSVSGQANVGSVVTNGINVYGSTSLSGTLYTTNSATIGGTVTASNKITATSGSVSAYNDTAMLGYYGWFNTASGNCYAVKVSNSYLVGTGTGFHVCSGISSYGMLYAKNVSSSYALNSVETTSDVSALDKISDVNVVNTSEGLRLVTSKSKTNLEDGSVVKAFYNEETNQEEMSIDYNSAISTLWKAIQELKEENEELKNKIKELIP